MRIRIVFLKLITILFTVTFFASCDTNTIPISVEMDGKWIISTTPNPGDPDIGTLSFSLTYDGPAFGSERWYGNGVVTNSDSIDGDYPVMGVDTDGNYGFHIWKTIPVSDNDDNIDWLNFLITGSAGDVFTGDYYGASSGPFKSDGTFSAVK